eukprot:750079-Hanusia_phi.AAC.2
MYTQTCPASARRFLSYSSSMPSHPLKTETQMLPTALCLPGCRLLTRPKVGGDGMILGTLLIMDGRNYRCFELLEVSERVGCVRCQIVARLWIVISLFSSKKTNRAQTLESEIKNHKLTTRGLVAAVQEMESYQVRREKHSRPYLTRFSAAGEAVEERSAGSDR